MLPLVLNTLLLCIGDVGALRQFKASFLKRKNLLTLSAPKIDRHVLGEMESLNILSVVYFHVFLRLFPSFSVLLGSACASSLLRLPEATSSNKFQKLSLFSTCFIFRSGQIRN